MKRAFLFFYDDLAASSGALALAERVAATGGMSVCAINCRDRRTLAESYRVRATPTVVVCSLDDSNRLAFYGAAQEWLVGEQINEQNLRRVVDNYSAIHYTTVV